MPWSHAQWRGLLTAVFQSNGCHGVPVPCRERQRCVSYAHAARKPLWQAGTTQSFAMRLVCSHDAAWVSDSADQVGMGATERHNQDQVSHSAQLLDQPVVQVWGGGLGTSVARVPPLPAWWRLAAARGLSRGDRVGVQPQRATRCPFPRPWKLANAK